MKSTREIFRFGKTCFHQDMFSNVHPPSPLKRSTLSWYCLRLSRCPTLITVMPSNRQIPYSLLSIWVPTWLVASSKTTVIMGYGDKILNIGHKISPFNRVTSVNIFFSQLLEAGSMAKRLSNSLLYRKIECWCRCVSAWNYKQPAKHTWSRCRTQKWIWGPPHASKWIQKSMKPVTILG